MVCDQCGKDKDDVCVVFNPYVEEIYGEFEEIALCSECYQSLCDEI